MQLRSGLMKSARLEEYNMLRETLRSMGLYEEGMQVAEMKEFIAAIQNSTKQYEQEHPDLENTIQENEADFIARNQNILSSTMIQPSQIGPARETSRPHNIPRRQTNHDSDESPPSSPKIITVEASVHRPMNWVPLEEHCCPTGERFCRKRGYDISSGDESMESTSSKRSSNDFPTTDSSQYSSDSGCNWCSTCSSCACSSYENLLHPEELGTSLQASTSSVVVSDARNTIDSENDISSINMESEF